MIDIEELLFKIKQQRGITLFDVSTIIEALEQQQSENKTLVNQLYGNAIVLDAQLKELKRLDVENKKLAGTVEDLALELGKNDDLIKQLKKDDEWFSVDDSLPDFGNPVICYGFDVDSQPNEIIMGMDIGQLSRHGNLLSYGEEIYHVTHWQPLPKPPEGES